MRAIFACGSPTLEQGPLRRPIAAILRRGRELSPAAQALLDSFAADLR